MELIWPDLGAPPRGWTVTRQGASLHLRSPDRSSATMVVSPLVPVSSQLPAPLVVIRQALAAEIASRGIELVAESAPVELQTADGLRGVRVDVTVRTPAGDERRAYAMFRDERWLYGLHYLARPEVWETWLPAWEAAASSVKPHPG